MTLFENLHKEFSSALKDKAYMGTAGTTTAGSTPLKKTDKKDMRLAAVFSLAKKQIEEDLAKNAQPLKPDTIDQLKLLEKDGKALFLRYEKATNTWKRSLMKGLAKYTPSFLKRFLCACFSNKMADAEIETKKAFHAYESIIQTSIKKTAPNPKDQQNTTVKQQPQQAIDLFEDVILDDEAPVNQPPTTTSNPAPSKTPITPLPLPVVSPVIDNLKISEAILKVEYLVSVLKQFDQRPLSFSKFKKLLAELLKNTKLITDISILEKAGLTEADLLAFSKLTLTDLLSQNSLPALTSTQWETSFSKAEAQKGHITFGIKKLGGKTDLVLVSDQNIKIKETDFKEYRGHVKVALPDLNSWNVLNELVQICKSHPHCRPCTVEIQVKEKQILTPELIDLLLELNTYSAEVIVNGLNEINFKAISADKEHQFVQRLDGFAFPDLNEIVLSDHDKKDWKPQDYSSLLSLFPTMDRLKEYFKLCLTPQEIKIPLVLTGALSVNFKGFANDHIPYLLSQFTSAKEIDLSGCLATDEQFAVWTAMGLFANTHSLHLYDCTNLTTDCLHALMHLKHLSTLTLPDLPVGKHLLDLLPSFEDPFKINLFYTASKATQEVAAKKYTGLHIWASVFQIPLARRKATKIFIPKMNVLDPVSAAFWLYQKDYKHLSPQDSITRVLADFNASLTDDNLVEFMQKFPNANILSLYNSPLITASGIIKLLKACPQLTTLDLTGCSMINDELFFGHIDLLKKLKKVILTDSGITEEVALSLQEADLNGKLEYTKTRLTITDADLIDDQSLETLLQKFPCHSLKQIDLSGCTKLNNQMLGKLLDRLNAPLFIKTAEGTLVDNPQRLNLTVLDLTGCSNIDEKAFDDSTGSDGKAVQKLLGTLYRLVIGGTKIGKILEQVYPEVVIQEIDAPVSILIDPDAHLQCCDSFFKTTDDAKKKELARGFMISRIVLELFSSGCSDQTTLQKVREQLFNPNDQEFCDITFTFKTKDTSAPEIFSAHRDVLYSQSLYFLHGLRPGGTLRVQSGVDYINVHATPKAAKALMEMLYGKLSIEDLDWETAADVAELAGPHIFNLPKSQIKKLIDRVHSQFDPSDLIRSDKMLMTAQLLKNQYLIIKFEEELIGHLKLIGPSITAKTLVPFTNIANSHKLVNLKKWTDRFENQLNEQKINQVRIQDLAANSKKRNASLGFIN